jgi:hypothetical protein
LKGSGGFQPLLALREVQAKQVKQGEIFRRLALRRF